MIEQLVALDQPAIEIHDVADATTGDLALNVEPRTDDELSEMLTSARREGMSVTFRGAGRSYGDAALNTGGLVIDLRRLNGVRHWDALHGVMESGPGLTIEGLWRRTIQAAATTTRGWSLRDTDRRACCSAGSALMPSGPSSSSRR